MGGLVLELQNSCHATWWSLRANKNSDKMEICICAVWSDGHTGHTSQGKPVFADVMKSLYTMDFEVQITLNRHLDFKCLDYFDVPGTWLYAETQVSI